MSTLAQRRTAAAAAIVMLFALLQFVIFTLNPDPANAAGPEPTYGTAVVDGDISEWDLGQDHFSEMYVAGDPSKPVIGNVYLRYDCQTSSLFVLALSTGDFDGLGEAWVKVYELGNSEANTTEATVGDNGFETVVPNLEPGDYTIEVHFNNDGDTASNARGGGPLTIECPDEPEPDVADVSVEFGCNESDLFEVTFSTSNASIAWTVGGSPATVTSGQTFAAGTAVSWIATADADYEFAADETDETGSFTAENCTTPPPPPPPPVVAPTQAEVLGALGDRIWVDGDFDGIQDVGETGVNGATVTLLTSTGDVLAQQVTDTDGLYLFEDLAEGTYRVEFCVDAETVFTFVNQGTSDELDSDAEDQGQGCALTPLIHLPSGVTDLTWDAGIVETVVQGIQIESTTTTIEPVTVGTLPFTGVDLEDLVWLATGVLAAGLVVLFQMGRRDAAANRQTISGWSNNR